MYYCYQHVTNVEFAYLPTGSRLQQVLLGMQQVTPPDLSLHHHRFLALTPSKSVDPPCRDQHSVVEVQGRIPVVQFLEGAGHDRSRTIV